MSKNTTPDAAGRTKTVIAVAASSVFFLTGLLALVFTIYGIRNYVNTWLFAAIFGTTGALAGLLLAKKLRPRVIAFIRPDGANPPDYSGMTMLFVFVFAAFAMFLGKSLNTVLSKETCGNYPVADKVFVESGFRRPEKNILRIVIDGNYHTLYTNAHHFQSVSVGEEVNVCVYRSSIGFDFFKLSEEK